MSHEGALRLDMFLVVKCQGHDVISFTPSNETFVLGDMCSRPNPIDDLI